MITTYLQKGTTVSIGLDGLPVVTGAGIAIFRIDNKNPHQFYYKGVSFEPDLNGCIIALDKYYASQLHIVGTSYIGEAWDVIIENNKPDKNHAWKSEGVQYLRLRYKLIEDLFLGRPFAEVIAQFEKEEVEKELTALKRQVESLQAEAAFAQLAKQTIVRIFSINEQGGKGSRVDVRKEILSLMPELATELKA